MRSSDEKYKMWVVGAGGGLEGGPRNSKSEFKDRQGARIIAEDDNVVVKSYAYRSILERKSELIFHLMSYPPPLHKQGTWKT